MKSVGVFRGAKEGGIYNKKTRYHDVDTCEEAEMLLIIIDDTDVSLQTEMRANTKLYEHIGKCAIDSMDKVSTDGLLTQRIIDNAVFHFANNNLFQKLKELGYEYFAPIHGITFEVKDKVLSIGYHHSIGVHECLFGYGKDTVMAPALSFMDPKTEYYLNSMVTPIYSLPNIPMVRRMDPDKVINAWAWQRMWYKTGGECGNYDPGKDYNSDNGDHIDDTKEQT